MVDVPQTTPHAPLEKPLARKDQKLIFPTAMYEKLHTNIPKDLMKFSDKEFPKDSQLFPKRDTVLECKFQLDLVCQAHLASKYYTQYFR